MKTASEMGQAKSAAKRNAARTNGQKGGRPKAETTTFTSLQELTHYESGAVLFDGSNEVWVGNWAAIDGLPRVFEPVGSIGLGEEMTAKRCAAPEVAKVAMRQEEREQGTRLSYSGFVAWRVNDIATVVIQKDWN